MDPISLATTFAAPVLLFVGLAVVLLGHAAWRMRCLVEDGVAVTGTVTEVGRGRNRGVLFYEYVVDGGPRAGWSRVGEEVCATHVVGGPVDVVYARARPWISHHRAAVDALRAQRGLPSL